MLPKSHQHRKPTLSALADMTVDDAISDILLYATNLLEYRDSDLEDASTLESILIALRKLDTATNMLGTVLYGLQFIVRD